MPDTNLPNTPPVQASYAGGENVPTIGTPEYAAAQKLATPSTQVNPAAPVNPSQPTTPANNLNTNSTGMDPGSFGGLLGTISQKIKFNNGLADSRAALLKNLYDSPLTPDEISKLPKDIQNVVTTGDKNAMELQVRVINDQLQGRAQTLDKVVQSLTTGYQNAQTNTKNAMSEILAYAQSTGKPIGDVAKALAPIYGLNLTDQLMKTLKEIGSPLLKTTQIPGAATAYGTATANVSSTIGADPSTSLNDYVSTNGMDSLVDAIIKNEGASPAGVQNNPGNIKYTGLPGQVDSGITADDGGTFASYDTPDDGRKAISSIIQNAANNNSSAYGPNPTIGHFIDTYTNTAPDLSVSSAPPDPKIGDVPNPRFGGRTPNSIYDNAMNMLLTGKSVQSYVGGLSSSVASTAVKSAISNTEAAIARSLGGNSAAFQALYKANASAATDNIKRVARVESIADAMTMNIPRIQELAQAIKDKGIDLTESDVQAGKASVLRKFGDPDAAAYAELIQTIRSDYAATQAALAGSRGGQFFAETANDAIPVGLTPEQYGAIEQTIQLSSQNAKTAINNEVNNLIGTSGSITSPNTPTNSNTKAPAGYDDYLKTIGS